MIVSFVVLMAGEAPAEDTRFVVTFSPTDIVAEPTAIDGEFFIFREGGPDSIPELNNAQHVEPLYSRLSKAHSIRGPWLIWVPGDPLSKTGVLAALSQDPLIENIDFAMFELENEVCGEAVKSAFPPTGGSQQNDLFCGVGSPQTQLHLKLLAEDLLPGDWCAIEELDEILDHDMDAPQAWGITMGDPDIVVAVIDIGFEWLHPALGGPGPGTSLSTATDSMAAYTQGVLYHNPREIPGDWLDDGAPGEEGVDDNNNGLTDEDSLLQIPGDTGSYSQMLCMTS